LVGRIIRAAYPDGERLLNEAEERHSEFGERREVGIVAKEHQLASGAALDLLDKDAWSASQGAEANPRPDRGPLRCRAEYYLPPDLYDAKTDLMYKAERLSAFTEHVE